MCKNFSPKKEKLRSAMRMMEHGESLEFKYKADEMNLSTIRVTACVLGQDIDRKFRVSKQDKKIIIKRIK